MAGSIIRRAVCFLLCSVPVLTHAQNTQVSRSDLEYRSDIKKDFLKFKPRYKELRAREIQRALILGRQVFGKEKQGSDVACAHQILLEVKWLLDSTADFTRIDQRLDDLQRILTHP